ncbi:MAG TPA: hypothetical protein VN667_16900 [Burkholderiales bacterium]|nr:hypothetical protein [Burkholderiales bacterium]
MPPSRLLIFVEDASPANYAALLLPALRERGVSTTVCATRIAAEQLRAQHVDFTATDPTTHAGTLIGQVGAGAILAGTAENPDSLGLALIDAARERRLPSAAFVDARVNAEIRLRGRGNQPLAHRPDWLLAPDAWTREAFVKLGFPARRIEVCGHPRYDHVLEMKRQWGPAGHALMRARHYGDAGDRPIWVFISEGRPRFDVAAEPDPSEYLFRGRGARRRNAVVLEEVLDARNGGRRQSGSSPPYFVYRAHPTEDAADWMPYCNEFDRLSRAEPALEVVYAADRVIGMTSTLLLEAALLGMPCLGVMPTRADRQLLPGLGGLIPVVENRAELQAALDAAPKPVDAGVALPEVPAGAVERAAAFVQARLMHGSPA